MADSPKAYWLGNPRARKEHKCCECRGVIRKGEKYHVIAGLWDEWGCYKTCSECETLRDLVCASVDHRDDCPAFGELYEHVFESRDTRWVKIFMDTRRARNAAESPKRWMEELEAELNANPPED